MFDQVFKCQITNIKLLLINLVIKNFYICNFVFSKKKKNSKCLFFKELLLSAYVTIIKTLIFLAKNLTKQNCITKQEKFHANFICLRISGRLSTSIANLMFPFLVVLVMLEVEENGMH